MAGGKLSPRQKMINMMYLVLTALLALNVSAEILEAFNSIRISLKVSADKFDAKNDDTEKAIIGKVDDEVSQGNSKNLFIKDALKELSDETHKVLGSLNKTIDTLLGIAGYEEATGELPNMKETEMNYQLWMGAGKDQANGGRGEGEAMKLKDLLNGYIDWANTKFLKKYDTTGNAVKEIGLTHICLNPEEDSTISKTSEHKEHTWEYFTFHGKPVIADLAMMEKYKSDVENVRAELLTFLKSKLGMVTFKIDSLMAVNAPVSRVVAAGMKFETKLFVAMSSKDIHPEFSGSGQIKNEPDGNSAMMTIQATGGFPAGKNEKEQSYSARIKVPRADGGVEELVLEDKFIVRKPEVVITSASVQNLYQFCGNTINVDVPALGEFYSPVLTASEADVINTDEKKKVTIVPRGKTCILNVKSNTNGQMIEIDNVKYKVIPPPRPVIELIVNGQAYNGASPINKKSTCIVKIKPDTDFAASLPKDARYVISRVDLLVQRSLGAPEKVAAENGSGKDATKGLTVELAGPLKMDTPGTKIYFKIDKVYRINFKNSQVEEKFTDRDLYVGAVVK